MEFGICMFATDFSMQAADLAVAVEERGFDALFIPDHTHIPASRETPFIIGGELPPDYSHNVDMFLALTAAALPLCFAEPASHKVNMLENVM